MVIRKKELRKLGGLGKRAQQTTSMPFGIIFSIILIVVFIIIAFVAVRHFLDLGDCAGIGQFYEGLQLKVDEVWASQESSFNFTIDVPSGIEKICFGNLSAEITNNRDYDEIADYGFFNANIFLIPDEKTCNMPYTLINHIDIEKITKARNPYCLESSQKLRIKKGFYDKFVLIE